jgi:hypothetical protein
MRGTGVVGFSIPVPDECKGAEVRNPPSFRIDVPEGVKIDPDFGTDAHPLLLSGTDGVLQRYVRAQSVPEEGPWAQMSDGSVWVLEGSDDEQEVFIGGELFRSVDGIVY